MKRVWGFFCTVCLILSFNGRAVSQVTQIRVACVGNSITYGGMGDASYPQQLGRLLGNHYVVKNFGVSGTTMLKKGDFPYWKEIAYLNARAFNPHIIIISLGTNDSKPWNWLYKEDYYADYVDMIRVFRTQNPNLHVLACLPPPVFKDGWGITNSVIRDEILPLIRQVHKTCLTDSINYYDRMLNNGSLFPDGIHPDAAGYLLMANIALNTLKNSPSGIVRYFNSVPDQFEKGSSCTLYWETTAHSQTTINGQTVADLDSMLVYANEPKRFTLITHGTVSDTAEIVLGYAPPGRIKSFMADPSAVELGVAEPALLQWSATRGSTVTLDGEVVATSGAQSVTPATTTTYTLLAGGEETDTAQVTVNVLPVDQINRAHRRPIAATLTAPGFMVESAVDGDSTTAWKSGTLTTPTITLDLTRPFSLLRVKLLWGELHAVNYRFQAVDDAGNVRTLVSKSGSDGGWDEITGFKGTVQRIRLLCLTRSNPDSGVILKEFQVYGSSVSTSVASARAVVETFTLGQNHPNPFNPTTTIKWTQPFTELVQLKIFDITGRELTVLVDGVKNAGSHQIEFNAGSFPSGVFLYRLQAGDRIETRKMILLK
jgi:acyl-CoA thioesterase I